MFRLQFRLYKDGQSRCIAQHQYVPILKRSAMTELDIKAGQYSVKVKITAIRDNAKPSPEDVMQKTFQKRPQKSMAVSLQ